MSTQNRISKALAALLPGGALGASILLALTSPSVGEARPAQALDTPPASNVAERLLAIRSAVSNMDASSESSGSAVPTWWGNGGWGRWRRGWLNGGFGWPNWHNWGNGGWGNGGWNNGGWHNYWHNY